MISEGANGPPSLSDVVAEIRRRAAEDYRGAPQTEIQTTPSPAGTSRANSGQQELGPRAFVQPSRTLDSVAALFAPSTPSKAATPTPPSLRDISDLGTGQVSELIDSEPPLSPSRAAPSKTRARISCVHCFDSGSTQICPVSWQRL